MDDGPQDRGEDRRRRGPLGDEEDAEETTRSVPRAGGEGGEEGATRRDPPEDEEGGGATRENVGRAPTTPGQEGTRVIRAAGAPEEEGPYTREERLRDIYGGVDWLASFIGCIVALLCGIVLLLILSGLVLVPLGFTLNLAGRGIDSAIIIGFVIVGVVLFLSYFAGGYVAGRLVRFDGGRNGAATVVWGFLLTVIFLLFGFVLASFLPGALFELLQEFIQGTVRPAFGGLLGLGLAGVGIVIGALLLELLGGFLGGRFGNYYHTRIDETT